MGKGDSQGGRPRIEIDMELLANMVGIQCTATECAGVLNVSEDTLDRRLKEETGEGFAEFFKKHSVGGKVSLRRAQFKAATEDRQPQMLVVLGKQMLGQGERRQADDGIDLPITLPTNRTGRPHKYPRALEDRRAMMSTVIECGRHGFSECEIAEAIDVNRVTMKGWANSNHPSHVPEFAEALDRAKHASQAWWERQARKGGIGAEAGQINAQVWKHVTACRFRQDYAERPVAYAPGKGGPSARVVINYIKAAPTPQQLHSTPQREHITIDANPIDADT
jgi:hypothetical protein